MGETIFDEERRRTVPSQGEVRLASAPPRWAAALSKGNRCLFLLSNQVAYFFCLFLVTVQEERRLQ